MKDAPSGNQPQGNQVTGGEHPLMVALRIRPMMQKEIIQDGATLISHKVDNNMVVLTDPLEDPDDVLRANRSREKHFLFDQAFDGSASQELVYQKTTRNLIQSVINGYNATVFAYGATGAGKTHTMLGTDQYPGLMVLALNDLFTEMENTQENMTYKVTMSYLEIYNEMVRDLLDPSTGYLDMREDAKGVHVAGLSEVSAKSTAEIMYLLKQGNKERTQEPTKANLTSSRSHAILQVIVKQQDRAKSVRDHVRVGKLFLIDLAGSERASNTQNRGKRMVEGAHINRSLLALGNCINALSDKQNAHKYVNFRDSKLTRLLKDGLIGNCRTVMIAHVSPASIHFEESRNTLVYAERAKNIKTKVRRNVLDVSYHVAQYTAIIEDLRLEINRLRKKVSDGEHSQKHMGVNIQAVQSEVMEVKMKEDQLEVARLKEELVTTYRGQLELRKNILELKSQAMEMMMETDRNKVLIKEWEGSKTRDNSYKDLQGDVQEKGALETDDQSEPLEVQNAREELKVLYNDSQRNDGLVNSFEKELDNLQDRVARIEEILPKKISSDEQKDIFTLLLKVNKMELENFELKVQILLHEHEIKTKTVVVERSQYHRSLCDDIIQQQRALLEDNNITIPKELEELYQMYQNEIARSAFLSRDSSVQNIANLPTYNTSLTGASRKFLDSEVNIDSESTSGDPAYTYFNELTKDSASKISDVEEDNHLFSRSAKLRNLQQEQLNLSLTSSIFQSERPLKADEITFKIGSRTVSSFSHHEDLQKMRDIESLRRINENDILTDHSHVNSTVSMRLSPHDADTISGKERIAPLTIHQKTEMMSNTRSIAALAAKKRADVLDRLSIFDSNFNKTYTSLHSNDNGGDTLPASDNYLTPSRLANHDRKFGSVMSVHRENDNVSVSDRRSIITDTNARRHSLQRTKYRPVGLKKKVGRRANGTSTSRSSISIRAPEPLREIKEPPHSESFHQLNANTKAGNSMLTPVAPAEPKVFVAKSKSMQRKFASRLPAATETSSNRRELPRPTGRVKFPLSHHNDLQTGIVELTPTGTPDNRTVHQLHPEKGRGLTVQRKFKGLNSENSNVSTPARGNRTDKKATPSITSYRKGDNSIAITGFSLAR